MNKLDAFLWGAFGAVVPEILKYYKLAVEHRSMPSDGWPAYVILSILFLTAAGAFTIAWNPESKQKAIWVGASFPALFATLASSLPPLPK